MTAVVMQIKNVEALKTWLTGRLEKICDADPAALAKYVVALVRKDKPLGELEEICIDQLEVFLANDTVSFVKTLFEVLQNNSYIPAPPTPSTPVPEPPKPSNPPTSPKPMGKRLLSTDETLRPQAAESSVLDEDDRDFKRTRKPTEEVEEKSISTSTRESHFGFKPKKRRAEHDHDGGLRNKVSRDDSIDGVPTEGKGKQATDGLRKKEGSDEYQVELERSDRPRESSSDRENSQRRFEGSSRGKHGDNRSNRNRPFKGRPWPNKRARCRDYEEKGYCMRGELCPYDHGNDPLVVEDVNIPIPGIVLGFPHGPRPPGFIPERPPLNTAGRLQGLRAPMPPIQFPLRPPAPPNTNIRVPTNPPAEPDGPRLAGNGQTADEHRPALAQPPIPKVRPQVPMPHYKDVIPNVNDVYNPEQPSFDRGLEKPPVWTRLGVQPPHHGNLLQRNRELLQVSSSQRPTNTSSGPQETVNAAITSAVTTVGRNAPSVQKDEPPKTRPLTSPIASQGRKYTNTVLEIKKLPPDQNNISTLNNYFQKFGKIVNIQVSAFGQPDMALIQFSTNAEANKAITCSDAVLGNRFIRVFWYKPDAEQKNQSRNVVDSQPSVAKQTVEKPVAPTMFHSGKTTFKVASTPGVLVKKEGNTQQVQEVMKKKLLIQKQKQALLGKQIAQQKLLINKLEQNKNLSVKDKEKIMQTLKSVSESITKLKSEAKVTVALAKSKESPAHARQVAKRELLDRELDLITHEQTGEDTTELRHRVEELKKEAQSLGLLDSSHRGRGRARGAPKGLLRGHAHGKIRGIVSRSAAVLDKRPKQLLVEGFIGEEKELVAQRFKEFGDINRIEQDKERNRLILTFGTRKQAENAILQVSTFNIKNLKVSWYRPTSTSVQASSKIPVKNLGHSDVANTMHDQDVEDLLLGEDLDEEEEEEERSWRR